jgi:hypothetical protein
MSISSRRLNIIVAFIIGAVVATGFQNCAQHTTALNAKVDTGHGSGFEEVVQ